MRFQQATMPAAVSAVSVKTRGAQEGRRVPTLPTFLLTLVKRFQRAKRSLAFRPRACIMIALTRWWRAVTANIASRLADLGQFRVRAIVATGTPRSSYSSRASQRRIASREG